MAPKRNAIIAGTGPPPTTIQSPTCRTHPVPMMAPKPMVKKFHSDSVFFMPPCSAVGALVSAIARLLSLFGTRFCTCGPPSAHGRVHAPFPRLQDIAKPQADCRRVDLREPIADERTRFSDKRFVRRGWRRVGTQGRGAGRCARAAGARGGQICTRRWTGRRAVCGRTPKLSTHLLAPFSQCHARVVSLTSCTCAFYCISRAACSAAQILCQQLCRCVPNNDAKDGLQERHRW